VFVALKKFQTCLKFVGKHTQWVAPGFTCNYHTGLNKPVVDKRSSLFSVMNKKSFITLTSEDPSILQQLNINGSSSGANFIKKKLFSFFVTYVGAKIS
jgi:hypothetical protein